MVNWQAVIIALGAWEETETKAEVPMDVGLLSKNPLTIWIYILIFSNGRQLFQLLHSQSGAFCFETTIQGLLQTSYQE